MYTVVQYQTSRNFLFAFISPFDVKLDSTIQHQGRIGTVYAVERIASHVIAGIRLNQARTKQAPLNNKLSTKLKQLGMNHHVS